MKKIFLLPAIAAAICMFQACSSTSQTTTDSTTDTAAMAEMNANPDLVFANKVAIGGMAEVELGKMAQSKTTNSGILDFANMMINDHTKANNELMEIAHKKNMTLPELLDAEHKAKSDSLSKLTGADFERAYVATMVEDHRKTLALMQNEASAGTDTAFKAFAAKNTPVIQMHLEQAQKLQTSIR